MARHRSTTGHFCPTRYGARGNSLARASYRGWSARGPRTHRSTSTRKIGSCSARSKIAILTFARSPHHPTSRADCHVLLSARAPAAICVAVRRQLPPKPRRYGTDTSPRLLLSTALCRPVLITESLRWSILLQPVEKLKDRITPHVTNFFRLRLTIEKQEGKRKYKSDGAVMVGEFVCVCMYVHVQ